VATAEINIIHAPRSSLLTHLPWRGLVVPVGTILAIEIICRVFGFQSDSVPLPSQIGGALWHGLADGSIFRVTTQTLAAALGGVALGAVVGLSLGILFGIFPIVFWMLEFTTEVIRPIPTIALIPLALLIFGFGYTMETALIVKSSIWPVLFVSHAAVGGIERRLFEVAKLLKLSPVTVIRKIVIPAILPAIYVGFRLSMGLALLLAIAIEIVVNPHGLGFAMIRAEETSRPDLLFALLTWTGLLGWAINAGLEWTQCRFFARDLPTARGEK
jgi:NitT/TauT family transport system permease protein